MSSDNDAAREVARTNFRATVISAALGCIGVVVAAAIGAVVGRSQGRAEGKQTETQQDAQIEQRDKRIAQLEARLRDCKQAQPLAGTSEGDGGVADPAGSAVWREPQRSEDFTFTLNGCSRSSSTVRCAFTVVAHQRDRSLYLFGSSRIIDEEGRQELASSISLAGREQRVDPANPIGENLVRGVRMSGTVTFGHVQTDKASVPLIELVESGGNFQFRDVPLS